MKGYRRKRSSRGFHTFSGNRNLRDSSATSYHNERQRQEKRNRLGYTTGTCAAGAAKAAAIALLTGDSPKTVSLLLPSGKRFWFPIKGCEKGERECRARASTVAADQHAPEVWVNLAYEENASEQSGSLSFVVRGGQGVGKVTKPGLPLPVGEDAIFPESLDLIRENLLELSKYMHFGSICQLLITIEIPDGEKLAQQSLAHRIGIEGGIAVQETPALRRMSTPEAWHHWIDQALTIAKTMGIKEVVLSPGGWGERFARSIFPGAPAESFILTADHVEHALLQAKSLGFTKIFYVSLFSKMLKAMTGKTKMSPKMFVTSLVPVYHLAMVEKVPEGLLAELNRCHTPREGLEILIRENAKNIFFRICQRAHRNLSRILGNDPPLEVIFVSFDGNILSRVKTEDKYGHFDILDQPFAPSLQPVSTGKD